MKNITIVALLMLTSFTVLAQNNSEKIQKGKKGDLYFYWGWNRAWYSDSDIHFTGDDYDFLLEKVEAYDRQSAFDADTYMNPMNMTIPQYNFRIGYFINDHYDVSFGIDHMKYVVEAYQTVEIDGYINNSNTKYDGEYDKDDISLEKDFLQLEHTDGLNYVNIEFRRFDEVYSEDWFSLNLTEGLGAGMLYPRTNTTLLNNNGHDEFHLAGYGFSAVAAVNATFFNHFFIQPEFKGGFINMPDVETTYSDTDKAKQNFFFFQFNVVLGASISILKK